MIRINLIPHRAEFRQVQIIEHVIVFVVGLLLTIALIVAVDIWESTALSDLTTEKTSLINQNRELSKKIGELKGLDSLRSDVEGKLQIVDELQAGRFRSLITLSSIAESMPENIWISKIEDRGGAIKLDGKGESSKAVANFMRALETSDVFRGVNLKFEQEEVGESVSFRKFSLEFRRLTLAEQEAEKEAEKAKGETK